MSASADVLRAQASVRETRYIAITLAYITAILVFFWVSFAVLNITFPRGYPRMGVPPGPGPYVNTLYSFTWWMIWLMAPTSLLPALLVIVLMDLSRATRADLHWYASAICMGLNFFAFVALILGVGCFYCNNTFSGASPCNSPLYCGVMYSYNPVYCANTAGFNPPVTDNMLGQAYAFYLQWVMALVFFFVSLLNLTINTSIRRYGAFSTILNLQDYDDKE
jgi:hypothetical protein